MKKIVAFILAAMLLLSLTACGKTGEQAPAEEAVEIASALELLNNVWALYGDNEKFSAAGGDMSEANMTMDAPGKFGVEDAEMLDAMLAVSADTAAKVDDAASLMHMMNANTFTCSALHAATAGDAAAIADAMKESISTRQWICGFPEKMIIMTIGDYVVSAFGAADLIETFKTHAQEAYSGISIAYEEAIA